MNIQMKCWKMDSILAKTVLILLYFWGVNYHLIKKLKNGMMYTQKIPINDKH